MTPIIDPTTTKYKLLANHLNSVTREVHATARSSSTMDPRKSLTARLRNMRTQYSPNIAAFKKNRFIGLEEASPVERAVHRAKPVLRSEHPDDLEHLSRRFGVVVPGSRSQTRRTTIGGPLGLLDRLPLELQQQIYGYIHHQDEYWNILHIEIIPEEPKYGRINAHPILAEEVFENSRRTTKAKLLSCNFYASQFDKVPVAWAPSLPVTLTKISSLHIEISYSAFAADVSSSECMAQLRTIRSNVSRFVDVIQASGPQVLKAAVVWDKYHWICIADIENVAMIHNMFMPDDAKNQGLFITYVLAPLRRLGGIQDRRDDFAWRRNIGRSVERLDLVYLDLKVHLYTFK